ncbi:MAG: hypothetical protein KDC35_09170 [Acidobacteria bacterium]|nr:hypothetical protein [Acidobacteriota bacterium]
MWIRTWWMLTAWGAFAQDLSGVRVMSPAGIQPLSLTYEQGRLFVGLETSIIEVDWETRTSHHVGLEEHRITALLLRSERLWAGAVSIYNLSTPFIYSAEVSDLSQWNVEQVFPQGEGNVRRLLWWDNELIAVTVNGVWQGDTQFLHEGSLIDAQVHDGTLMALFQDGNQSGLWIWRDGRWQQSFEIPSDIVAFASSGENILLAAANGDLWLSVDETLEQFDQVSVNPTAVAWDGDAALVSYSDGLVASVGSGPIQVFGPGTNLASVQPVLASETLFVNCQAQSPFVPAPCRGLYHWSQLGKLDLNQDGRLDRSDVSELLLRWHSGEGDLTGDDWIGPEDLALVLTYVSP